MSYRQGYEKWAQCNNTLNGTTPPVSHHAAYVDQPEEIAAMDAAIKAYADGTDSHEVNKKRFQHILLWLRYRAEAEERPAP